MKHIMLFEKFNSSKLTKTLGYIKSDDRDKVLNLISKISNKYDFPQSQLSDDMFEYLPYKRALTVTKPLFEKQPTKCDGESEWIPGNFCDEGKVKRTWGKGFRSVDCIKCSGSGFLKENPDNTPYCIKFWFDKDGGIVKSTLSIGSSSNLSYGFRHSGDLSPGGEVSESELKDAHFAVILYLDKMIGGDYKKRSEISDDREDRQVGIIDRDYDRIKKINLDRYISKLVDKFELDLGDLSNINNILPRLLGNKNTAMYFISNDKSVENIRSFITSLYRIIKSLSDGYVKYYMSELKSNIKSSYDKTYKLNVNIIKNKEDIVNRINSGSDKYILEVLSELEILSQKVYDKLTSIKVESIEDMEVILLRITSIQKIFKNERYKLKEIGNYFYYLNNNTCEESIYYLQRNIDEDDYKYYVEDIKAIGRIIDRL